jgi:uncharacterized membrane protein (DUF485 family)
MNDTEAFLNKEKSERRTRLQLKARRIALLLAAAMLFLIVVLIWLGAYELAHPGACFGTGIIALILILVSILFATNGGEDLPW